MLFIHTSRCAQFAPRRRRRHGTGGADIFPCRARLKLWCRRRWWPKVCSWSLRRRSTSRPGWQWLGAKTAFAPITQCCSYRSGRVCLQNELPFTYTVPWEMTEVCVPHTHYGVGHKSWSIQAVVENLWSHTQNSLLYYSSPGNLKIPAK